MIASDPIRDTKLFCFGLFISLFQFALLFLMAANVIVPRFRTAGEVDNPGVWFNAPIVYIKSGQKGDTIKKILGIDKNIKKISTQELQLFDNL